MLDKPTLIFTNGWSTTAQVWHYFRKDLSQDYNLIFWDEPGLGKSNLPESDDYSLDKYASDPKNIIEQNPANKVILIGHSIGGMIIQELYKLYPDLIQTKVAGLVLMNTTYINPIHTSILSRFLILIQNILLKPILYLQVYTWPIWQLNNILSFLNGGNHLAALVSGFSGKQTKQEFDLTARFMTSARVDVVNKGNLAMMKFDNNSRLKDISIPTLILAGSKDIMTKPDASAYMASQIPDSQLNIISGANHMGLLEYHQDYLVALRAWLKQMV